MTGKNIKTIYEDNHIIVVEKPVNIASQADDSGDADMLSILKDEIKNRYGKPGNVYLGLVHRLDRPVGGVMVFAKTSKAASRLSDQIRKREFEKRYMAVVHGVPKERKGSLHDFLYKDVRTNIVKVVPPSHKDAKEALLDYQVAEVQGGLSLVHVNLHTGRSHQIRVQLSSAGYPIYGDQKYGADVNKPGQQIALWSSSISFSHPTKKEMMVFNCRPPDEYPWNLFEGFLV